MSSSYQNQELQNYSYNEILNIQLKRMNIEKNLLQQKYTTKLDQLKPFKSVNKYKPNDYKVASTEYLVHPQQCYTPQGKLVKAGFPSQILARHSSQQDLSSRPKVSEMIQISPNRNNQEEIMKKGSTITFRHKYDDNNFKQVTKKMDSKFLFHGFYKNTNDKKLQLKQTSSTQNYQKPKTPKCFPMFNKQKSPPKPKSCQLFSKQFTINNFDLIKKLGQGKFGSVFLAKDKKTGMILAIKTMEKSKIIKEKLLTQFIRQLKIQLFLNHPNIIKAYGFFHDQLYFYTLMELGSDGQLYNLITMKNILTQRVTSYIVKNLLGAVNYLHNNNILHRDIKPQNIVLIHGNVKLCDFGWVVDTKNQLRSTFCGTPLYLSPQLLKGQKYDEKIDLWAIGILAYQLHLGISPFHITQSSHLDRIIKQEITFPENKYISKQFKQFITCILKKNPRQRMSGKQLLNLKFIKKYQGYETCEELCH